MSSGVCVKMALTERCDLVALSTVERGSMVVTRSRGFIVSIAVVPEEFHLLMSAARALVRGEKVEKRFWRVDVDEPTDMAAPREDGAARRWWPKADPRWAGVKR